MGTKAENSLGLDRLVVRVLQCRGSASSASCKVCENAHVLWMLYGFGSTGETKTEAGILTFHLTCGLDLCLLVQTGPL